MTRGDTRIDSIAGTHVCTQTTPNLDKIRIITQAGYLCGKVEPYVRYELLMFNEDHMNGGAPTPAPVAAYADDRVHLLSAGLNDYVNDFLKVGGDVVYAISSIPTDSPNAGLLADGVKDGQVVTRIQAQLKF